MCDEYTFYRGAFCVAVFQEFLLSYIAHLFSKFCLVPYLSGNATLERYLFVYLFCLLTLKLTFPCLRWFLFFLVP